MTGATVPLTALGTSRTIRTSTSASALPGNYPIWPNLAGAAFEPTNLYYAEHGFRVIAKRQNETENVWFGSLVYLVQLVPAVYSVTAWGGLE